MKYLFSSLLMLYTSLMNAAIFDKTDEKIAQLMTVMIKSHSPVSLQKNTDSSAICYGLEYKNLEKVFQCRDYIKKTYVTADIDAYNRYVTALIQYGIDPVTIPAFSQLLSAEYEKVNSKIYFNIAHQYYLLNQYDKTIAYLKKIDDTLDDQSVYKALLMYGTIYFENGDYKKAKYHLGRIDEGSSEYRYALYNLALISMRSHWWTEAEGYIRKAISTIDLKTLTRNDEILLDRLYLTLGYSQINRKNFRGAKASFKKISINSPVAGRAMFGLAMSHIGLGALSEAAPVIKYLIQNNKSDEYLDALVTLPEVYRHANNLEQAVKYYNKALAELTHLSAGHNTFSFGDAVENNWVETEYNKRKQLLSALNIIELTKRDKSKLKQAIKLADQEYAQYVSNKNEQTSVKIANYIKQVKYALAVIYDNSMASNE